jgi:glycosyltransferase involved in cell wall biosynthesis
MRIGYFSSKFPYNLDFSDYICGGSVLATHSLIKEIAKMNHEIKVFTTSKDYKNHIEISGNIEVYRYGTQMKLLSSNLSLGLFIEPLKYDVDLVHVSFDIPPGPFAGYRYAKKKNLPLIVTYHGDWEESYGNILRKIGVAFNNKFLVDKILSYAQVIISPSKTYLKTSEFLRKYKEKVIVIPNGVNMNEFKVKYSKEECRNKLNLPIDEYIVLFFGYLSPYKSPDILIKALSRILKYIPSVLLVFAGSGVMMDELKKLSADLGVDENVKFVGFIGKDQRSLYYKSADIFCLPSTMKTESFGIANLEAMSSGIPIVASNFGGIPDVVKDDENGLLIPPNDIDALVHAIIYLLKNNEIREKMGLDGKNKASDYTWKNITKMTDEIYRKYSDE